MEIISLATAFGFGALAVKILDIIWLQDVLANAERKKWLRDKRLESYSELLAEILTLGTAIGSRKASHKGIHLSSKAILLVDDEAFSIEIREFFIDLENLDKECLSLEVKTSEEEKESNRKYSELCKRADALAEKLRVSLRKT
jgi:hypothetical protein